MQDSLDLLPVDKTSPSHSEIQIMETLFKENKSSLEKLYDGLKDIIIIGVVFVLFSLPQVDNVLQTHLPSTSTSKIHLIGAKVILFMLVVFIALNSSLLKKPKK